MGMEQDCPFAEATFTIGFLSKWHHPEMFPLPGLLSGAGALASPSPASLPPPGRQDVFFPAWTCPLCFPHFPAALNQEGRRW